MKKGIPCKRFVKQTFFHCRSFSIFLFNKIMLYTKYLKPLFNSNFLLSKASCFSSEARNSFSQLWTKSIYLSYADLVFRYFSKNNFAYYANNFLLYPYFLSYGKVYCPLWKMLWNSSSVLLVAICKDGNSTFSCWKT